MKQLRTNKYDSTQLWDAYGRGGEELMRVCTSFIEEEVAGRGSGGSSLLSLSLSVVVMDGVKDVKEAQMPSASFYRLCTNAI